MNPQNNEFNQFEGEQNQQMDFNPMMMYNMQTGFPLLAMSPMFMQQQQQYQYQMMMQQKQKLMMQQQLQSMVQNTVTKAVQNILPTITNTINNTSTTTTDAETVQPKKAASKKKSGSLIAFKENVDVDMPDIQIQEKETDIDSLTQFFNKTLDKTNAKSDGKRANGNMSKKNKSNVVINVTPKNVTQAHFNKETNPNELYNLHFMLYDEICVEPAENLSEYTLEVQSFVYNHNKSISPANTKSNDGFIYSRCSSENTVSIATQRETCFKYALDKGIKLCNFGYQYDNGVSGRNMDNIKAELGFWSEHIPNGGHIIIYSVDRLSRNVIKGLEFINEMLKKNITFHFITNEIVYNKDSSATKLGTIQSLLVEAEKFSNMTSEKIKNTRKRLIEEGNDLGRAKYGFSMIRDVNEIRKKIVNEEETKIIKIIKNHYKKVCDNFDYYQAEENLKRTFKSIYEYIARWCNRKGIKYRNGDAFTEAIVHRIIKS
jgi:DNA invertase Pin-like site-specific DNA recombinase